MRRKYLPLVVGLLLTGLLIAVPCASEPSDADFEDDGIVEEVQDESPAVGDVDEEIVYESPQFDPKQFYFVDHFDDIDESGKRWVKSQAKKDDIADEIAKYDGEWEWESPQRIVAKKDKGLVLKSKAKHAAIAARLHETFTFKDKPLVVQYEVTLQEGQECGGSYIKLLSAGKHLNDLSQFNDKTPYTIMFGPDKCGNDHKMHFIFRHVNPINGSVSEKHCRKPKDRLEEPFKDKLPHLYQLVIYPNNKYEIRIDHKLINDGSLLTEFTPPVNPPREIDDPEDKKPVDWDDREKIADPTSKKPEDWDDDAPPQIPDPTAVMPDGWLEDEPEMIADPSALKPEDWDAEIDGEWEAPLVDNPVCEKAVGCGVWKAPFIQNKDYKGKWRSPLIDNPNFQGKWSARKIPNPDYFEDLAPFQMTPISAIGIEIWSMSDGILFDNMVITDDVVVARDFAAKSFDVKRKYIDKESKTLWHRLMRRMNYKPGWWALYFLYLLIPASCYVFYLYRRAKEESFFSKMLAFASENPWASRIGLVLSVTLFVFSIYRLFSKGSTKESTGAGDPKKTDAPQEDDVDVSGGDGGADKAPRKSSPTKKSDLDLKDDDAATIEEIEDSLSFEGASRPEEEVAGSSGARKRTTVVKD